MSKEKTNSGTMTEQKLPSSFLPAPEDVVNYSKEEEQDTSDTESTDEHSQTAMSSTTFNFTTSADSESYVLSGFSNAAPRDSTQRPAALRKTRRRPSFQAEQASPELRPVLHLFDIYSRKVYIEGYLCKQDQNGLHDKRKPSAYDWREFYVELCGPVLSLWEATKNLDIAETAAPRPTVINISHSIVESLGTVSDGICVFWLDAGEGDQYYFQAQNATLLNKWVLAIRLSCFEGSRLQEVYTATLFRRSGFKEFLIGTSLVKGKFEGHLQVRFTGTKAWKKYWVVVSDHRLEDKKKKDLAFTRGQITFYETKKSKKPFMTMANVLSAFAIYPEVPSMIDKTTHFRVEGNIFPAQVTDNKPGDYVLLMAETSTEMAKWMVGFFDSFKLYGRPKELLYNFNDSVSPLFGVPMTKSNTKLFLDIPEVEHVDMGQSLADVKAEFAEVLRKMHEQKLEMEEENDPSSPRPRSKPSVQIPPQIITSGLYENSSTRQRSNGSTVSTPSSGSPSLKAAPQLMRPPSLLAQHSPAKGSPTATTGSQKSSLIRDSKEVLPLSPQPTSEKRISQNTRMAHTTDKQGKPRKGRQLASSDEDEDDDDDSEDSKDETESDTDSEVDDPTLLKNTRENAKTINSPIKLNLFQSEGQSLSITAEPHQLETTAPESSGIDLMSEIMTSFSERKEDNEETPTKPKRSVSFKNPPKLKSKHKRNLTPVPSNSEEETDSEEEKATSSEGEKDSEKEDDQEKEEATNSEDGKKDEYDIVETSGSAKTKSNKGKETKLASSISPASPKTVEKGKKKKKVNVIPQPSDSEEEENGEEAPLGLQLQAAPRIKRRELSPRRDFDPYDDRSYPSDYRQPHSYEQYGYRSQQAPYMDRGGPYSPSYPYYPSYPYSSDRSYSPASSYYPPVQDKDDHVPLSRGLATTTRKPVLSSKSARNEKPQGTSKGKKPIKRAQSIEGSDGESTESEEEAPNRDTEESETSETSSRNENPSGSSKGKEKEISNAVKDNFDKPVGEDLSIYLPTVNIDFDFDTLKLDSISGSALTDEKNESVERSSSSSDSGSEDVVKPRRTFKPTKRKDKSKLKTRKSSDSSDSDSSTSQSSSQEPLVTIVPVPDDPPLPYSRGYSNTPPRSVSPSYQYYDNDPRLRNSYMGYPPLDNRRGTLMPPREYDDDYMGGRPRSVLNTPPGRRRVSGGQADYQRDMYYEDEERVDYPRPTRLSAREQEYLAREAGVPLIQIEEKPKDPESGLVGHITARERQRKLMGSNIAARQLELERENERRFYERQQYDLPSPTGDPRSNRFYGSQQYLDAGSVGNSRRNSYYDGFGSYGEDENDDDDDDDDDVPLGVAPQSPGLKQTRGSRVYGTRRRDTE